MQIHYKCVHSVCTEQQAQLLLVLYVLYKCAGIVVMLEACQARYGKLPGAE